MHLCFVLFLVACMSACANVYFKTTFKCPRSIAGVPFNSVRRFGATLLLRTTCMRLWGNWVASCVSALQTKPVYNAFHRFLVVETKRFQCVFPYLPSSPLFISKSHTPLRMCFAFGFVLDLLLLARFGPGFLFFLFFWRDLREFLVVCILVCCSLFWEFLYSRISHSSFFHRFREILVLVGVCSVLTVGLELELRPNSQLQENNALPLPTQPPPANSAQHPPSTTHTHPQSNFWSPSFLKYSSQSCWQGSCLVGCECESPTMALYKY